MIQLNDKQLNKLDEYTDELVSEDKFSGTVLLAKGFKEIVTITAQLANKEKEIPNTLETKFNLGSCNKMFTGVAIAQLVEKGECSFDDLVGKFLPDYPNPTVRDQITLHHLLTHTSGLGSFIDLKYRDQFLKERKNLITIQSVVNLFKDRPLEFPIGQVHYSSDGYEILGLIIEKISDQNYYDFVRQNIFQKAGMENTDNYLVDENNIPDNIAMGYTTRNPITNHLEEGERVPNINLNLIKGTAGGSGYSTCPDLLKFAEALQNHILLTPEMLEKIWTPYVVEGEKDGWKKSYGYGFQVWDIKGLKRIGHPGRFAGVSARFDIYPDLGYIVAILSNYDPPIASEIGDFTTNLLTNSG